MEMAMNTLYINWHLGLGDAIICNGLIRVLARQDQQITIPAKHHNVATVTWMFSDLPNVTCVPVRDDAEMIARGYSHKNVLSLGVHSGDYRIPKAWDAWFYNQAGVPHECRWSEFKLPPDIEPYRGTPVAFVHDDESRGYVIRDEYLPRQRVGVDYAPSPKVRFGAHVAPLQRASEIHVIDSSFLCLADTIETSAKRLVLHQYATAKDVNKRTGPPTLRKNWEILT